MKTLYAIPTHHCNLHCPHCDLKNIDEKYNAERFLQQLNIFEGHIILFGGEPSSNIQRMRDVIESNKVYGASKIGSVSTNLMVLDKYLIEFYKEIEYIATSWNNIRFSRYEYLTWLHHIKELGKVGVKPGILITLTNDLMDSNLEDFLTTVDGWPEDYISWIKFEHWISKNNTPEYYTKADEWLCEVYKAWRSSIRVENFDKEVKWYHNCSEMYTLEPNGILYRGCPNSLQETKHVLDECLVCDHASECRPCILHPYCSYPNKLRKLLEVD